MGCRPATSHPFHVWFFHRPVNGRNIIEVSVCRKTEIPAPTSLNSESTMRLIKRQHPDLPEQVDTELGEIAGEALRAVLHREIELASMRWAPEGELLPIGEPTAKGDSPVFSASEACARMALQAAKRSSGSVASRFRGRICRSVSCGCKKNSAPVCGMFSKISVTFELSFPRLIRLRGVQPRARLSS